MKTRMTQINKLIVKYWISVGVIALGIFSPSAYSAGVGPLPPEIPMTDGVSRGSSVEEGTSVSPRKNPSTAANGTATRVKTLDFDSNVIEGMNRDPLDAAEHVGKKDVGADGHLYRTRLDFKRESVRSVQEAGTIP